MKTIIISIIILLPIFIFAQQTDQGYVITDSVYFQKHFIEPKQSVKIHTNKNKIYKGRIDSIKHNTIYVDSNSISFQDIAFIKYKRKIKIKQALLFLVTSTVGLISSAVLLFFGMGIFFSFIRTLILILSMLIIIFGLLNFFIASTIIFLSFFLAISLFLYWEKIYL